MTAVAKLPEKFRKKPVVIEAMKFDGTVASADAIATWAKKPDGMSAVCGRNTKGDACYHLRIETLEGAMTAVDGDWIIRGVKGEFYPCKPDIFAATYEPAALSPAELGGVETEQSIAADCYHWIAECIGTLPGYSVQEHVQTMKETLDACSDFLHDFVPSDEGGCDEAVELARNCRAVLSGRIDQYEPTPRAAEAEWLPIDSAPKDCPVIVSNGESVGEARYHESEDGWWWAGYHPTDVADGYVWQPTHWRPLPAPPALTPPSAKGE